MCLHISAPKVTVDACYSIVFCSFTFPVNFTACDVLFCSMFGNSGVTFLIYTVGSLGIKQAENMSGDGGFTCLYSLLHALFPRP